MAVPIASDIKTLKFNFRGRPFVRGTKTVELRGMSVNFRGLPFVGVDVEVSNQVITAQAGSMQVSGGVDGITLIATGALGEITVSGSCVSAEVIAGITMIEAAPGVVSIEGVAGVYGWIGIIAEPAVITLAGSVLLVKAVVVLTLPAAPIGDVSISGSAVITGPVAILHGSKRLYECVLSLDGLSDVVVPISSFTSRQRAGDPSYSEVIIPGLAAINDVLDRQTGTFTVSVLLVKAGVTLQREILFETEISAVSITGNNRDQQIMLSGYRTSEAAGVPAVIPVSGVIYRSLSGGLITLRKPEADLYMRPGDTVQYDGDEFIVGLITLSYSAIFGSSMEIRESETA